MAIYQQHTSQTVHRVHDLTSWYCRGCLCTGCKTVGTQAIRLSYFHTSRLFSIVERKRNRVPSTHKLVGAGLARVLHSQICLLLQSHAQQSMTHSVLLQAQLCSQARQHPHALLQHTGWPCCTTAHFIMKCTSCWNTCKIVIDHMFVIHTLQFHCCMPLGEHCRDTNPGW